RLKLRDALLDLIRLGRHAGKRRLDRRLLRSDARRLFVVDRAVRLIALTLSPSYPFLGCLLTVLKLLDAGVPLLKELRQILGGNGLRTLRRPLDYFLFARSALDFGFAHPNPLSKRCRAAARSPGYAHPRPAGSDAYRLALEDQTGMYPPPKTAPSHPAQEPDPRIDVSHRL